MNISYHYARNVKFKQAHLTRKTDESENTVVKVEPQGNEFQQKTQRTDEKCENVVIGKSGSPPMDNEFLHLERQHQIADEENGKHPIKFKT